ncbi:UNVERIFIED_CONTAM: hypothetical protein HDU68_007999 [Siphonaria sp. JEL0065]|nr:hypothetical protein HDU68_007999 [Siphonaria sp. JEL0065]
MVPPHLLVLFFVIPHFVICIKCFESFSQNEFSNCKELSPLFALHWAIKNDSDITFGVDAGVASNSNAWVGVGISEMGGMFGADIWLLKRNDSGGYDIQDSFSMTSALPVEDTIQNVQLLSQPTPSDTNTAFTFTRRLKTCDEADHEIIEGQNYHVIWAFGSTSSSSFSYHGANNRGNAMATLYHSYGTLDSYSMSLEAVEALAKSSNLKELEIKVPLNNIPSNQTSYLCTHLEVPADRKYHVVEYEPILTSNLVHHMILYACKSKAILNFGDIYNCESMQSDCSTFALAWAPGIDLTVFPPEAGFAIGTGPNAYQYFALQIHYNNPNQLSNVMDSSGLKLHYTNQLRPNDVGVLILGSEDIHIPGNSSKYTATPWNVCPSTCTRKFPTPLTVISNGFHMHTLGHNATTRQIRSGKEITPLGMIKNYNF